MIKVFEPSISYKDIYSVIKSLLKNEISGTSKVVYEFEKKFAQFTNRQFAVAVSNGSTALDLAFQNFNFKKGDEVIIPSFTIISCLSAVIRAGCTPVFCDVDENTWNMSLFDIKSKITKNTKAVLLVHTYGLPSDAIEILNYCNDKNIIVIEDSSEAHGQSLEGKLCGNFGDISIFSFYANKHITTGEGGILVTDSKQIKEKLLLMRNLDFRSEERFQHNNLYWNYRLGGLQAALGVSQIQNISKVINLKKKQGKNYYKILSEFSEYVSLQAKNFKGSENHYWVFGVVLKKKGIRDKVIKELLNSGIETRPFFWPLHEQKAIIDNQLSKSNLPISENLGRNGLYLPLGKKITKSKQKYIVDKLISCIREL
jgi:perosamine synthetase